MRVRLEEGRQAARPCSISQGWSCFTGSHKPGAGGPARRPTRADRAVAPRRSNRNAARPGGAEFRTGRRRRPMGPVASRVRGEEARHGPRAEAGRAPTGKAAWLSGRQCVGAQIGEVEGAEGAPADQLHIEALAGGEEKLFTGACTASIDENRDARRPLRLQRLLAIETDAAAIILWNETPRGGIACADNCIVQVFLALGVSRGKDRAKMSVSLQIGGSCKPHLAHGNRFVRQQPREYGFVSAIAAASVSAHVDNPIGTICQCCMVLL